jgi:hypothetical protein
VATKNVAYRVTFSYAGVAIAGRARELFLWWFVVVKVLTRNDFLKQRAPFGEKGVSA